MKLKLLKGENNMNGKKVKVFKNDYGQYKIGISKKNEDNTYDNSYFKVQFKKDIEMDNQTDIIINNCWITFYTSNDGEKVPYLFISEFDYPTEAVTVEKAGW
jgi:hypothetical protein